MSLLRFCAWKCWQPSFKHQTSNFKPFFVHFYYFRDGLVKAWLKHFYSKYQVMNEMQSFNAERNFMFFKTWDTILEAFFPLLFCISDKISLCIKWLHFIHNLIAMLTWVGTFGETDEMLAIELDIVENQYCTLLSDRVGQG